MHESVKPRVGREFTPRHWPRYLMHHRRRRETIAMEKPRCQGCLGDLQVERPEGQEPYVWCLRCGARDERDPLSMIALLGTRDDDEPREQAAPA